MDRPLVVFDTETATLSGPPHLLELGAVRVAGGEVQDTFESLVCPPVPIDADAIEVHGITESDVRAAPLAEDVIGRFAEWVGADPLVAHDARADGLVLGFEYARSGQSPPPGPLYCTLALARRHMPEAHDHRLDTLVQELELEGGVRHRALADAVYCWKVLEECLARAGAQAATELATRAGNLTIALAAPAPARMSPRLRPLEGAIASGRGVRLVYGTADEPPATLPVLPRFLFQRKKKSYLEAECERSGLLKTYRLDRVRKVLL